MIKGLLIFLYFFVRLKNFCFCWITLQISVTSEQHIKSILRRARKWFRFWQINEAHFRPFRSLSFMEFDELILLTLYIVHRHLWYLDFNLEFLALIVQCPLKQKSFESLLRQNDVEDINWCQYSDMAQTSYPEDHRLDLWHLKSHKHTYPEIHFHSKCVKVILFIRMCMFSDFTQ